MAFVVAPGSVIDGRYVLRAPLGRGGMGTVWRAEHAKLKTEVAVKLVAPSLALDRSALERFQREAQLAASLESPHVVRILDFGVHDGAPYIAMELLAGETLGARLSRMGALKHAETLRIAGQIARGIGRAHQAGIVHRDVKPENVFVARVDGEEIAKVLDFGVAKAETLDPLTVTGAVVGTLQYMSPEQIEGRRVDARSDLHALALIVFECVCGRAAFDQGSIGELVVALSAEPRPVPSRLARVPAGFDAWFARAAHRDPSRRFASARELSDALAAVLGGARDDASLAATLSAPLRRPSSTEHARGTVTERRGGDERAGYRIGSAGPPRCVQLEIWGLWDVPLARAQADDMHRLFAEMGTAPWTVISLSQRNPPQKAEVQEIRREVMRKSLSVGVVRSAIVVDSAIGQMQIRRLWTEVGALDTTRFFTDEAEARAWLAEVKVGA
jgi:serine/threonine-protein kinase